MPPSADLYPTPWRLTDHDGRIAIVAANGAKVTEVGPGQLYGRVPTKAERVALAQRMIEAVNPYTGPQLGVSLLEAAGCEIARSPDAPWLGHVRLPICGESEDGA